MTIGLIGLGSIGERHIRNIQKLYPSATVDVLTKRKDWKGGKNVFLTSSSAEFYKTKHDVYFITNETVKHVETIKKVLAQHPQGIFIEKPLSHSVSGLSEIQKKAKKQGTVVFVGYNLQFFKPLLKVKELIGKKTIGEVKSMNVFVGQDLRAWRAGDYRKSYSADSRKGGGVVLDLIHDLNYPGWLLQEELQFIKGGVATTTLPIQSEDLAESILRSTSGVVVDVHQDYLENPGRRALEVVGSKGRIIWKWGLKNTSTIRVEMGTRSKTLKITEKRDRMYQDELSHFLKKVAERKGYSNLAEAIRDVANAEKIKKHSL